MFGENLMPRLLLCDLLHNRNLMHGAGPGKARQVVGCSMGGRLVGGADSNRRVAVEVDLRGREPLRAQAVLPAPGVHRRTHRYTTFYELSARSTLSSRGLNNPRWPRCPIPVPGVEVRCRRPKTEAASADDHQDLFGDGKGSRIRFGRTPTRTPVGMPRPFRIPATRDGNPRMRRTRPNSSRRMTAARSRSAAGSTSDTATKSRHTSEAVTPAPHWRSARIALRSHLPL